ncbi:hypothetical protein SADUNF_Sadunf07G0065500 [Salix dunnii]|uniref:Uncharacterized protein n=1 Tax=Salix dunnii TaxID=1413687 RepID=A0A835MZ23_9ROSI|nr:hypothetical protein SADUNF_Sadunf07G0065500 [Salix dunnii]
MNMKCAATSAIRAFSSSSPSSCGSFGSSTRLLHARREKPKLFTKAFFQPKVQHRSASGFTNQHRNLPISSRIRQQDQEPPRTMMNGVSLPTHLNSHASSVPILTRTNFSEWKEQVEFTLGVLDLDLALLKDKPDPLTDKSTPEEKTLFNTWERSDRLSIMFLRMTIASKIKTSLPKPRMLRIT